MVKKQEKTSRLILEYLRKNPDGGDTLEGITNWWLEIERIELSLDAVANALENLIKRGAVMAYETERGSTFYRIKQEKKS